MDLRRNQTWVAAILLAVAVLVLTLVGAGPTYAGVPRASSDASSPPTSDEAYAMQLRAQFGFESDLAYVRTVAQRPDATQADFGVPLTPAEAVDMQRRGLVGAQIVGIDSTEADDSTYAGAWLDQQAGGVLNLAFTSPPSTATLDSLTSLLPAGTTVAIRSAATPTGRLNSLENQVGADMADWKSKGVVIASSNVDLPANTTRVYVTSDIAAATAQLDAAYGHAGLVVTSPGGPTTPQSARDIRSGPVYGGEWINDGSYGCTAGYANSHGNVHPSNVWLITAGHCDSPGHAWAQGLGSSPGIGSGGTGNGLYEGHPTTNCDCQGIGTLPSGKSTTNVLVGGNAKYPYTRLATPSDYYTGRHICVSGAHEYEAYGHNLCGTLTSTNGSAPDDNNVTLVSAIEASFGSTLAGDSGGPYGDGGTYMGVHFGLINGHSSFSRSSNIPAATISTPRF